MRRGESFGSGGGELQGEEGKGGARGLSHILGASLGSERWVGKGGARRWRRRNGREQGGGGGCRRCTREGDGARVTRVAVICIRDQGKGDAHHGQTTSSQSRVRTCTCMWAELKCAPASHRPQAVHRAATPSGPSAPLPPPPPPPPRRPPPATPTTPSRLCLWIA